MSIHRDARTERRNLLCLVLDRLAAAAPTEGGALGRVVSLADLGADAYLLALVDLLAALGAVEVLFEPLSVRTRSPNAGYLCRLLSDLIDSGAPLVTDWRRERLTPRAKLLHPFGASVDLLSVLELRRLELMPGAAPVREIEAATGLLVRRDESGRRAFLLIWDDINRAWQLPGGHYERRDGSPSMTLLRKLREDLGLDTVVLLDDVCLAELGRPLTEVQLSPTCGLLTRTVFHSYIVRLRREPLLAATKRWVSESEALAGRLSDGQNVSAEPLGQLVARYSAELDALLLENQQWSDRWLAA